MTEPLSLIFQVLLAVVIGSVGYIVKQLSDKVERFSDNLEKLAQVLSDLRVEMQKDFVSKDEYSMIRQRFHDMANNVSALMAQAELNRRRGDGKPND